MCVYVVCGQECAAGYPQRPEEDVGSIGTGAKGSHKSPILHADNQTQVLSRVLFVAEPFLQPHKRSVSNILQYIISGFKSNTGW